MKHRTPFAPPATPAGITYYTLLRKVVCQMGALPPLETPTRKGGTLPLHGAHTAFSCYPALRLYQLSKSQRGIDVVSLTLGKSGLPAGNRLVCNAEPVRQLRLRPALFPAKGRNEAPSFLLIHFRIASFAASVPHLEAKVTLCSIECGDSKRIPVNPFEPARRALKGTLSAP